MFVVEDRFWKRLLGGNKMIAKELCEMPRTFSISAEEIARSVALLGVCALYGEAATSTVTAITTSLCVHDEDMYYYVSCKVTLNVEVHDNVILFEVEVPLEGEFAWRCMDGFFLISISDPSLIALKPKYFMCSNQGLKDHPKVIVGESNLETRCLHWFSADTDGRLFRCKKGDLPKWAERVIRRALRKRW